MSPRKSGQQGVAAAELQALGEADGLLAEAATLAPSDDAAADGGGSFALSASGQGGEPPVSSSNGAGPLSVSFPPPLAAHHSAPLEQLSAGMGAGGAATDDDDGICMGDFEMGFTKKAFERTSMPPLRRQGGPDAPGSGSQGAALGEHRRGFAAYAGGPDSLRSSTSRSAVRRQTVTLKKPLSRTSTRSFLASNLSTSTLNVLGRVNSNRDLERLGTEATGDGASPDGAGAGNGNGNGGPWPPRPSAGSASSTTGGYACTSALSNGSGDSGGAGPLTGRGEVGPAAAAVPGSGAYDLRAPKPALAVPRVFSFFRSLRNRQVGPRGGYGHSAAICGAHK